MPSKTLLRHISCSAAGLPRQGQSEAHLYFRIVLDQTLVAFPPRFTFHAEVLERRFGGSASEVWCVGFCWPLDLGEGPVFVLFVFV